MILRCCSIMSTFALRLGTMLRQSGGRMLLAAAVIVLCYWVVSQFSNEKPSWMIAQDSLRRSRRENLTRVGGAIVYPTYARSPLDPASSANGSAMRILCWIMTSPANMMTKAAAVNRTWLQRCDVRLFMSSAKHEDPAVISIVSKEGRQHLTRKTMQAFKYVYDNHFHDCDWFLKADDDTYVVVENLRLMLAGYRPEDAVYFGHRFKLHVKPQGYHSGGAGYILSKQALFRYGEYGYNLPEVCSATVADEDVAMGRCMQNLDVRAGDTLDAEGRNRFHAYHITDHLSGVMPPSYPSYDWHGASSGLNATSPHAISFHYVTPQEMFVFEYLIYHFSMPGARDLARLPDAIIPSGESDKQAARLGLV